MIDTVSSLSPSVSDLVTALPEKYQPIFGYPSLSDGSSRACEDRLELILDVTKRLRGSLSRPVRVLDLGCAQGFFSLSLAAEGCIVHGADFLDRNVAVCQALAKAHGLTNASFELGRIEDIVVGLHEGQYDLILGLSVFHHLVYEHGMNAVVDIIGAIAKCAPTGIYELAVREEPLYWGSAQPEDPSDLLQAYALTRVLSRQVTHLSQISRPLYFTSNRYWFLGDDFREFNAWRAMSHSNAMNSHMGTRRYYFADGVILKRMSLSHPLLERVNRSEYEKEVKFLTSSVAGVRAPRLIAHEVDGSSAWILREQLPGRLLSELIDDGVPYSYEMVADGIIDQLVALEDAGLYHDDVRCWNVLMDDEGSIALIDYGAISALKRDCVWPDDPILALLITLRELVHVRISPSDPIRRPLLDITVLPARYRDAYRAILELPQALWSFRGLRDALGKEFSEVRQGWEAITSAQERALLAYEHAILGLRTERSATQAQLNESLSNAHNWYLRAMDGEKAVGDLTAQHASESAGQQELRHSIQKLSASFASLREQLSAARGELDVSLQEAHHWYLRATAAEQHLKVLQDSKSWRFTRPLRFAARAVKGPRAAARRLLVALQRRVLRRPLLARSLNRVIRMFPSVHARLRSLAVHSTLIESASGRLDEVGVIGGVADVTGLPESKAVSRLSIRGEEMYDRMLAKRNREKS